MYPSYMNQSGVGQSFPSGNYNPYTAYASMMGQQSSQSLIRVTGIDGARAYQMGPNSAVPLFDANDDIFFVKSTDGAGFPTIRAFRFAPLEDAPTQQNDFVTRQEFEELKGMILNGKQPVRKSAKHDAADE